MDPENVVIALAYGVSLTFSQRIGEAISVFDKTIEMAPQNSFAWIGRSLMHAVRGEKMKVLESITHELQTISRSDETMSWWLADCYAAVDEPGEALEWLDNAVSRGFINYPLISSHDPFLKNLRHEARFEKLLEKVKREWEEFEV
jgi:non-specific serine/threonine protein kinase